MNADHLRSVSRAERLSNWTRIVTQRRYANTLVKIEGVATVGVREVPEKLPYTVWNIPSKYYVSFPKTYIRIESAATYSIGNSNFDHLLYNATHKWN